MSRHRSGGPFSIGPVVHSLLRVGFTTWFSHVVVFNLPLNAEELGRPPKWLWL
jgi:hypothetical protein